MRACIIRQSTEVVITTCPPCPLIQLAVDIANRRREYAPSGGGGGGGGGQSLKLSEPMELAVLGLPFDRVSSGILGILNNKVLTCACPELDSAAGGGKPQ